MASIIYKQILALARVVNFLVYLVKFFKSLFMLALSSNDSSSFHFISSKKTYSFKFKLSPLHYFKNSSKYIFFARTAVPMHTIYEKIDVNEEMTIYGVLNITIVSNKIASYLIPPLTQGITGYTQTLSRGNFQYMMCIKVSTLRSKNVVSNKANKNFTKRFLIQENGCKLARVLLVYLNMCIRKYP